MPPKNPPPSPGKEMRRLRRAEQQANQRAEERQSLMLLGVNTFDFSLFYLYVFLPDMSPQLNACNASSSLFPQFGFDHSTYEALAHTSTGLCNFSLSYFFICPVEASSSSSNASSSSNIPPPTALAHPFTPMWPSLLPGGLFSLFIETYVTSLDLVQFGRMPFPLPLLPPMQWPHPLVCFLASQGSR